MSVLNSIPTRLARVFALAVMTLATANAVQAGRLTVEAEGGAVWQSKNDVQIPNSAEGTRFSLVDVTGEGPTPAGRIYLTWSFNDRHSVRALAAPLKISEAGVITAPVDFAGASFTEGTANASYRFNSWRLTYAYKFYEGTRWMWRVGFTAKVRDAKVQLQQGDVSASKTDIGFVPLLNLQSSYALGRGWHALLDVDALAGGPGRAIDGSFKLAANIGERTRIAVGYRTVEGGADVDEVYNFAWLHYAVASISFTL